MLVVSSLSEWSTALRAQEALGVPGEVEGGHAPVQHWALAAGAPRGEETVVVGLAVRPTVALEEAGRAKLHTAVGAQKVLQLKYYFFQSK